MRSTMEAALMMFCVFIAVIIGISVVICRWIFRIDEFFRLHKETNRLLTVMVENQLRIDWFLENIHQYGISIKQKQPIVRKDV